MLELIGLCLAILIFSAILKDSVDKFKEEKNKFKILKSIQESEIRELQDSIDVHIFVDEKTKSIIKINNTVDDENKQVQESNLNT